MPTKMEYILSEFKRRDIELKDLAILVLEGQKKYLKSITIDDAMESVEKSINKREIQHSLLTALAIDNLAMENKLPEPFQSIIEEDAPLYGVDETIAMEASALGGSISSAAFGYLDNTKPGIIGKMNDGQKKGSFITTMLDDQLSALVAVSEAKLAHKLTE